MDESVVGIERVENFRVPGSVRDSVYNLLNLLKESEVVNIPPSSTVLIKVNICTVKGSETGATVDPDIVKYFIEWLLENYAVRSVIVAEADATWLNADIAFDVLGWKRKLASLPKVRILNLSKDERVEVNLEGHCFETLEMSRTYMEADFLVSIGKLKTNDACGMSCILKNQFGSLPEKYKAQYHEHLTETIFDLNKVRIPDLSLVDAIIAMEGNGPMDGIPKPLGLLVAGNDPVSTDHACARIVKIPIGNIPYLRFAIHNGLGRADYRVLGTDIRGVAMGFQEASSWRTPVVKFFRQPHLWDPLISKVLSKIFFPRGESESG